MADSAIRLRESDRRIRDLRGPKALVDARRAYAVVHEEERNPAGVLQPTLVVFLTNRECPFTCVMCDLWTHTLDTPLQPGDIPRQIASALAAPDERLHAGANGAPAPADAVPALTARGQLKLYNAGSFFDPFAIPPDDDQAVADLAAPFERVIVESHPAFLRGVHGERALRFRDRLRGRLEVAVGLETAHAGVLAQLNKRMTLDDFTGAAAFLRSHDIDLRVFILLRPPFMTEPDGVEWACRSLDVAFDSGATACSIIPTRGGNGVLETLGQQFAPPTLSSLEAAAEYGLSLGRGRVFADTWDLQRFYTCECSPARADRLRVMTRDQRIPPPVSCDRAAHH